MKVSFLIIFLVTMTVFSTAWSQDSEQVTVTRDSLYTFQWEAIYQGRLLKEKEGEGFPWNVLSNDEWRYGRLSLSLSLQRKESCELFLKFASISRNGTEEDLNGQLIIEQGHISVDWAAMAMKARLFSRERVYITGNRLLKPVSSDAPLLENNGEGVGISVHPGKNLKITYLGVSIPERVSIIRHGGFPVLHGTNDRFNLLEIRVSSRSSRLGLIFSETRSDEYGDVLMAGVDAGIRYRGLGILLDILEARRGRLESIGDWKVLDIDYERMSLADISSELPGSMAMSAEIHGIERRSRKWGEIGIIPSWKYYGADLIVPCGEVVPGLTETRLTSWWKHPDLALSIFIDAVDSYRSGYTEGQGFIRTMIKERFRNGLSITEGMILRESRDPLLLLSMMDDSEAGSMRFTSRLENPGDRNILSFLAEGQMNLTGRLALRTSLFLQNSLESLYSAEVEFRSGNRFLFRAGFGSFINYDIGARLLYGLENESIEKNRYISFYGRVALGDI
ncbi:MAG: hypothetical protein KAV42_00425 [Candidatus Krumholzibacteria bacterium]|nr:hypothetical protein [Candidatus Krumholzibacteria bacterium]